MQSYNITETSGITGQVIHSKVRNVVTSGKSPWVLKPGSRTGKTLQLRQNAFEFFDRELGPGYDFVVSSSDKNQASVTVTSTNLLGQFSLWTQFGGVYSVPFEEQQRAVAKWYNEASGFTTNVAEIYATRKQTISMVGNTIFNIANAAVHARKRNWRGVCLALGIPYKKPTRRNRNNIPNAWLEYNYGWKPLLSDIHIALNHPFPAPYRNIKTSHIVTGGRSSRTTLSGVKDGYCTDNYHCRITVKGKVTVAGTALAAISSYGVSNPLSLAWELLPFSFVLDWLLPVGSYLEQLTALNGCVVSDKSTTTTVKVSTVATGSTNYPVKYGNVGFACKASRHSKKRVLSFTEKPFPQLKNPLSLQHVSYALSLLSGALQGFDRPSKYPRKRR